MIVMNAQDMGMITLSMMKANWNVTVHNVHSIRFLMMMIGMIKGGMICEEQ